MCVIGGALMLSRLAHGQVDHYWSRGALILAWTGKGMALHAHYIVLRRVRSAQRLP